VRGQWLVVVLVLVLAGCGDDGQAAPPTTAPATDPYVALPDPAGTIDTDALFLRQEGDGTAHACTNGGDSSPVQCYAVFDLPELDVARVPGAVAELDDQWSAYEVRIRGDLDGIELRNVELEAAPGSGDAGEVVDEFDCPVPEGSGGDPQAVVDHTIDLDVRVISAYQVEGEPVQVIVPYVDRPVAEAVCGLAGPGVAIHLGGLSTVT
jgi:hypothetical protein